MNFNYIIAIDIAKYKCDLVCFDSIKNIYSNVLTLENSVTGVNQLIEFITFNKKEVLIVMESTAHYHLLFADYLSRLEYQVCVFNPILTNHAHLSRIRKTKNDKIDSKVIAQLAIDLKFEPNYLYKDDFANIKSLTRFRKKLVQKNSKNKIQLCTKIDYLLPEYNKLFHDKYGKLYMYLLSNYTLIEIKKMRVDKLTNISKDISKGNKGTFFAKQLKSLLKQNALIDDHPVECLELKMICEHINYLNKQIDILDTEISKELGNFDDLILTIPGINKVSAAIIMAEIGNINKFNSPKKLVAFAGLDSKTYESGTYSLASGKISKRGSPYLRHILFLCANAAKLHSEEFNILYQKHRSNGKHHYVALNAIARRLLHIIWGINKTQTSYNKELLN